MKGYSKGNDALCLQEVQKRFPSGLPLLDPVEDMGIKEKSMKDVVKVMCWQFCILIQL